MKTLPTYISLFLIGSTSNLVYSQNKYVDSLKTELTKSNTSVTATFDLLNKLTEYNRTSDLYKQTDRYINQQIKLAKRENNQLELVKAYVQRGVAYDHQQFFDKTQKSLDTIQKTVHESSDFLPQVYYNYLLAYHQLNLGDYTKSQKTTLGFISQLEKIPDEYILKSKTNYILYRIHATLNNTKNAIIYAEKSLIYAKESEDKNLLVMAYANLGFALSLRFRKTKDDKDLNILIETSRKAVEISRKNPNKVTKYNYAIVLLNLSDYQLSLPDQSSSIKEEIKTNSLEVIELCKTIPNAQHISAGAYSILSKLARDENQFYSAETYLIQANEILHTQHQKDYHALLTNTTELAKLYNQKGEFQKAFEFQKKATDYSSELYNQDQAESTKRLEAQFQSERKEVELKNLEAKNKSLQKERILYIFLGVMGLIGMFFMFRTYHFRLHYSIGRENQLNAEKQEADIKLKLQHEEQARLQAEQELLTLQQQKLQDEVLASQLHLEHKNNVLKELKDKIKNDSSINLKQVIREGNMFDNDFDNAKFRIQELHPNFFKTLNEHSKQKLTPLDLKYCSYIYLGLDTKKIANLLNIEPKSVRMKKYRLKQKFGLTKSEDLNIFFHQIIS
ncbi:helix-turn-helix transcriptional regulator [Empedobacter brevis]|nr:LuxR C-terminal-related transcriptional regulator [Empedobacter brevis]QHC84212.1 hypothetical protein AS589_05115 [Empedobacter brevis]